MGLIGSVTGSVTSAVKSTASSAASTATSVASTATSAVKTVASTTSTVSTATTAVAQAPFKALSNLVTSNEAQTDSETANFEKSAIGKTGFGRVIAEGSKLQNGFMGGLVKGPSDVVQSLVGLVGGLGNGSTETTVGKMSLASNKFQTQLLTDPRAAFATAQQTTSDVAGAEWANVKANPGNAAGEVVAQVGLAVATGGAGGLLEGASDGTVSATELATAADVASSTTLPEATETALQQAESSLGDTLHQDWQTTAIQSGRTERFKPYKLDGQQVEVSQDKLPQFLNDHGVPASLQGNYRLVDGKLEEDIVKIPNSVLSAGNAAENNASAQVVMGQIRDQLAAGKPLDDDFIEKASAEVHTQWVHRNEDWAPAEQKFSFDLLSTEEADKDRDMVRAGIAAYTKAQGETSDALIRQATSDLPNLSHDDVRQLLAASKRPAPSNANGSAWRYLMAAAEQEADRRGIE